MTVLVGILCQDGVVLGSDSSATFGPHPMLKTIEQTVKKTAVVGKVFLHAGTGQVGLGQRFHAVLEKFLAGNDITKIDIPQVELGKALCRMACEDFGSTGAEKGQFGALVAHVGFQKKFGLIEFSATDFQPELKTKDMWFASMGSGQAIVDPFFGLLKGALFKSGQPKLNEGIFAAVWALRHVIELNTGGINGPMQLGTIAKDKTDKFLEARLLSEEELAEHVQNVEAMTEYVAAYRDILSGKVKGGQAPLPPPPPPASGGTPMATIAVADKPHGL